MLFRSIFLGSLGINVSTVLHIKPAVIVPGIIGAMLTGASVVPCQFQFPFLQSLLIFPKVGAAAKPPNLRISASGNTQYELTQGINSPWARRFTLDPMGRLPSTRQWALPLDPNRALHPCTQHKELAVLCTPARRSRLPPLVRFLSAPPALNAPFVAFPSRGDTPGILRYQFTARIPGADPSFSRELT